MASENLFNYLIAAPWPDSEGLCEYNIFGVVKHGTLEHAEHSLAYVRNTVANEQRSDYQPKAEDFQIYQVVPIK